MEYIPSRTFRWSPNTGSPCRTAWHTRGWERHARRQRVASLWVPGRRWSPRRVRSVRSPSAEDRFSDEPSSHILRSTNVITIEYAVCRVHVPYFTLDIYRHHAARNSIANNCRKPLHLPMFISGGSWTHPLPRSEPNLEWKSVPTVGCTMPLAVFGKYCGQYGPKTSNLINFAITKGLLYQHSLTDQSHMWHNRVNPCSTLTHLIGVLSPKRGETPKFYSIFNFIILWWRLVEVKRI